MIIPLKLLSANIELSSKRRLVFTVTPDTEDIIEALRALLENEGSRQQNKRFIASLGGPRAIAGMGCPRWAW
jgi:hypothetical protein